MIQIQCEQGQAVWHWHRLGIPTASQFHRILTPKTRKYASGAEGYMHELLAEWLTGIPHGADASGFMERGNDQEPRARAYYEFECGVTVQPGGVCLRDDQMAACSPDGLVSDNRGVEFKVPSAKVHVGLLLGDMDDYFVQVQGNLWLTDRNEWDVVAFNDLLPPKIVTVKRDDEYIEALEIAVNRFVADLKVARQRLLDLGAQPAPALEANFASSLAMKPGAPDPF